MIFVLWTFAPGSFIDTTDENNLKADYLKKLDELGIITAEDALRAVKEDDFSFNWIEEVPEQEDAGGLDMAALMGGAGQQMPQARVQDAAGEEFKEADHPRDESGCWTSGSGSTGGGAKTSGEAESSPFGENYQQFKGKPEEAIEHLLKVKNGYVAGAAYKEGIGDIDFVYGETGEHGYGIAHIIERRIEDGLNGEAFVRELPKLIKEGTINRRKEHLGRLYIETPNREAVISLSWYNTKQTWLVSAYDKYK